MVELIDLLEPGDGVWWGQANAEPTLLVRQLLTASEHVRGLRGFSGATWDPVVSEGLADALDLYSYGALGDLRHASRRGRLTVLPCHYSALPRRFEQGLLPRDVALVQVSPPDADGCVTLGFGADYFADALPHARVRVAEVNHRVPATVGGPRIPLSSFDHVVESDLPSAEVVTRPGDDVDRAVAGHVASLVQDGDTVQVGVGSLPNEILAALRGHRDLGFHAGIVTDGVLDLVQRGVVTGARKEVDAGVAVAGTAFLSSAWMPALADLPVEFRATSRTHDPAVLARLGSLVSINSAIEVDLRGQVGAEQVGGRDVGAVGGQVDFSRSAAQYGRCSVIALRSSVTLRDGSTASTIVPRLAGPVTTGRVDVDHVVTEHGVAHLRGCSEREAASRLLNVAAPEHREALERELHQ